MSKRLVRFFSTALGAILLLGILAACGAGTSSPSSTSSVITIKIATDFPVSGQDESSGKPAENGAHLAVDQANASHFLGTGYQLVFDPQDDVGANQEHDPSVGANNVTALIGDAEVAGIVGPFNSNVAESEMPIANRAPIVLISPSNTNTCLTQDAPSTGCTGSNDLVPKLRPTGKVTYFRTATTDTHQGGIGADFSYKTLGLKTVYVIDDTELYGVGLANNFISEFEADGGKVLGHDSIASATDYSQELTKIAALKPAFIYFAGLDSTGGINIAKQMAKTPGLAQIMVGGDGLQTSAFASAVGTNGVTVYSTVASVDATKLPSAANFIKQYDAAYGAAAFGAYSAQAYDDTEILLNAIKAAIQSGAKPPTNSSDRTTANAFRQAVIDEVAKTNYNGITGHQSFDSNGDTTNKTITIYKLEPVSGSPGWGYVTSQTLP